LINDARFILSILQQRKLGGSPEQLHYKTEETTLDERFNGAAGGGNVFNKTFLDEQAVFDPVNVEGLK